MELTSTLQFLKLHEFPQAWVNAVWNAEFAEVIPMETNIEDQIAACADDFRSLYTCLLASSRERQSLNQDDNPQNIWIQLRENGVSVQCLVAVLSSFVLKGKSKAANVQQRLGCLHAASLYILLLGITGSIANKVFHEIFLDTCLRVATHCWPQDSAKKRKKDTVKSFQAEGKRTKPHRKETQEIEVDEGEEELELNFSNQDLNRIRGALVVLVQSIVRLLETSTLKEKPQIACSCIQIFTKLLYFEPVIGELNFAVKQDITELQSIPEMAFKGLQLICSSKHGDQKESLRRVFHRLLYVILMMDKRDRCKPTIIVPSLAVLATRDQTIHFVCHIVNELKELAHPLLKVLLQQICLQMVEKCEFRTHGSKAIGILSSEMSNTDYANFIKWLFHFSRHSKMVSRLFSVDVVMVLLGQPERVTGEHDDPRVACYLTHQFLIQNLLFARRHDNSPTVQSHVFTSLAQCLELPSLNATSAVHNLFSTTGTSAILQGETTEGSSHPPQNTYQSLPFRTVEVGSTDSLVCDARENIALLLRRVQDSKANVRKTALQVLVGFLKHGVIPMTWENVSVLSEHCRDPAISVKKKALECFGEVLNVKSDYSLVLKAWLEGVLPAVVDSETSVKEKALEALENVLLSQVKPYAACRHLDTRQRLTWNLLKLLCHECRNLSYYFSQAITIWTKQNKFDATFITNLISHTEADHSSGAWLFLSKVVTASPQIPYGKILDAWDNMVSSKDVSVTTCCNMIRVIGDISSHLNEDTKDRIVDDLISWLKSFTMSLEVISAAIDTLCQFGSSDDVKQTQVFLNQYCGELMSVCEEYLAGVFLSENGMQNIHEELMVKHLHTFGNASLNCPSRVTKRMVFLLESVLTTHLDKLPDCQDELLASLPVSQFKETAMPTKVRAHGVITLAKLCLHNDELVQKCLPVFARELEIGKEVTVRNNLVVIMCDLCVRYTNIVQHYIPNLSTCLGDNETVIREQTLIMLTNLLQEEFVKWKGSLFFRFMVALVDPVPAIASLCEYCLLHLLLQKTPEMFSQHFIECIYHFNSYNGHKAYNKFPQTEREKVRFSLKGPQHREKRFRIYRFLLQHFTDAQRFNISHRISQHVLACFADEELPLDADGSDILSETFHILTLKEMKLQAMFQPLTSGDEQEEANMATMAKVVLQTAQNKVASQVKKKAFIENTVPLIINLKHLLEQKQSPVLKDLTAYLQVTMQDYRNEVQEFFAGDDQLAAEVEFALKEAEKPRIMEKQMDNCNLKANQKILFSQASIHSSPVRPRTMHSINFATPQPLHQNHRLGRHVYSESRMCVWPRIKSNQQSNSLTCEGKVISQVGVSNRAISTPNGDGVNLTFEEGVSCIYSDKAASSRESSILQVRSGDEHRPPKPRQWNVDSPLRLKERARMSV
ncbi:condensin-2 complex subunit D3 [Stigmatopora argus]